MRLRLRRGRRRHRLQADRRARSPSAAEGNGIDGYQAALDAGHVRPVGLRRQDGRAALPLHDRRRGQGTDPKPSGFFADEIKLTSGATTVFTDGAENGANGWTPTGFSVGRRVDRPRCTTTTTSRRNRTYVSYDQYLQTGPYNFGFPDRPDWVEHFPYQNGLLVSYWDTSYVGQQREPAPGRGPDPADRRAPARRSTASTAQPWRGRDPDLRRAVRRWRRPTRSRCTRTSRAGQLHPRPGRGADVRRPQGRTGTPRMPTVGVKVPHAGVQIAVTQAGRHVDADQDQLDEAAGELAEARVQPAGADPIDPRRPASRPSPAGLQQRRQRDERLRGGQRVAGGACAAGAPAGRARSASAPSESLGERGRRARRSHRRPSMRVSTVGPRSRAPRVRSARRRNARSTHAAWATSTRPAIASSSASAASSGAGAPARSSSRSPWIRIDSAGHGARRPHEALARAGEHDAPAVDRHGAPGDDRVAPRVQPGRLEVDDAERRLPPRRPPRGHGAAGRRRPRRSRVTAPRGADRWRSAAAPRRPRGTPPSASGGSAG